MEENMEKYKFIYNDIKNKIDNNVFKSGEKIPNEIDLSKEYGCSRMTIKKGMELLVQEGLIYRKKGLGSFVMTHSNSSRIEIPERELSGLTKNTKQKLQSKILEFKLEFASKKVAQALEIKQNDPVYKIHRLRSINGRPHVLELTYMNTQLTPGIDENVLNHSIYSYLENQLNLKIASAKKITRADKSTEEDQKYLGLKSEEPVLEIEQIAYLDNGTPFEYSFSRHRYDLFEFTSYSVRR